jgi:peptidoglycan/LPS O-acetylase OafA/YrhL
VAYYALFAFLMFLPGKIRYVMVIAWFLVAGPKIALYLPLWLIGVGTYKILATKHMRMPASVAGLAFILPVIVYIFLWHKMAETVIPIYQLAPLGQELWSFCFFTLTGILAAMNILAFHALVRDHAFWPDVAARWIRWAAGASFTLYLVHQPLIVAAAAIFPITAKHGLYGGIACLAILALAFGVAELGERRKRFFAKPIRHAIHDLFPPPAAIPEPRLTLLDEPGKLP